MDYKTIPENIRESLEAYRDTGRPTGGCLEAILSNDLMEAFGRADEKTAAAMQAIVGFIYNEMPSTCHGSQENVDAWLKKHAEARRAATRTQEAAP